MRGLSFYLLAVRIAASCWLLLCVVSAIYCLALLAISLAASMIWFEVTFVLALIAYLPVSLCWGLYAAYGQWKSLAKIGDTSALLSVGREKSINLELPVEQAIKIAESALRASFSPKAMQLFDMSMATRISDSSTSARLFSGLYEDRVVVTASAIGGSRSALQISCVPVHTWLFGFFAADFGRCARRMMTIETAIEGRVRAQNAVLDEHRRIQSARASQSEAELSILRAQVEPHFIFNTLAHVRASLGPHSEGAAALLDALVEFLRRNTQTFNSTRTALGDELDMAESYLKLVAMRMGERLRYNIACPPALRERAVPAACVLVLVENAVKHGIERSANTGRIAVECALSADALRIEVCNDGPGFDVVGGRRGGLSNLQDRMRLMYGAGRWIDIESPETGGVCVTLHLPLKAAEA